MEKLRLRLARSGRWNGVLVAVITMLGVVAFLFVIFSPFVYKRIDESKVTPTPVCQDKIELLCSGGLTITVSLDGSTVVECRR